MPEQLILSQTAEVLRDRFSVATPLLLEDGTDSIKLELKPYLQPFERVLALRELQALLAAEDRIEEEHGHYFVRTCRSEDFLRQRLTYWQRVGRAQLEPSLQTALEFTQNGISSMQGARRLHNARRLRYGPHDLHQFRGKFFPQLVRSLINIAGVADNALVLDPMCGSGTTLCEALASGRSAIGADLNPLSVLIAAVKAKIVLENPDRFFETVSKYLTSFRFSATCPADTWSSSDLAYLKLWFDPDAIQDLSAVVTEIESVREPLYRDFFLVCLSNTVRSVSWQKDTDLRVRKEVRAYAPGTALLRFNEEANRQLERIYPYLCILPQSALPPTLSVRQGNAVNIAEVFSEYLRRVDLLVTSPPYATALPYLDTDRLSLVILRLLPRKRQRETETMMIGTREISEHQRREAWDRFLARRHELPASVSSMIAQIAEHNHGDGVGFRRRNLPALLGTYFLNMLDVMRSARTLMVPGADGYFVVGNNSTIVAGEKWEIPTHDFLFEIGAVAGWCQRELISMELLASRDIFRDNRGSAEMILSFSA